MRNALALLALSMVACGGSVSSSGDDPKPHEESLVGSYELTFSGVTVVTDHSWPSEGTPPSNGATVRVDLVKTDVGLAATVVPPFGVPATYGVALTSDAVTLTGDGISINGNSPAGATIDRWTKLVLARSSSGALAGTITGEGEENVFSGDVGWMGKISGGGAIAPDAHAPDLRAIGVSPIGPGDALLPWDALIVDASEPIAIDLLKTNVVATDPVGWADVRTMDLQGRASRFDLTAATVSLAKPVTDAAGNARSSFRADIKYLAVGAPAASYSLDAPVAAWGSTTFAPSAAVGCSGGCAKIGPVKLSVCGAERAGIAVRAPSAASVSVRWRIVAESPADSGEIAPYIYGNAMAIDVAAPSVAPSVTTAPAGTLTRLEGRSYASDWVTTTASAPAGKELGISVRVGDHVHEGPCEGLAPDATTVTLYVDSIDTK